jgi:hypothetical protein
MNRVKEKYFRPEIKSGYLDPSTPSAWETVTHAPLEAIAGMPRFPVQELFHGNRKDGNRWIRNR